MTNHKLRWAYMDHWRIDTAQGPVSQYTSREHFDSFLKQLAVLGFEAIETFDFHLHSMRDLFGSLENCRSFPAKSPSPRIGPITSPPYSPKCG